MKEKTTIYLVRHGQTEWNVEHRFQGHQDSPLTENGIIQAKWLGEALANERLHVICASSSPRAVMTAELIGEGRGLTVQACDAFMELGLGEWEGMNQEEAKELYPQPFDQFWNDPESFGVQGGESFAEAFDRARNALLQLAEEHAGKTVLIVTHTVIVKLLMAYFENRPLRDLWKPPYIHPTCLSKIELYEDGHAILLHGDISHYQEK
ncbi:histidine phosphatase family protein [Paenibacillus sp. HB172176]|uniref:histidine phosphatase family protein n=1 Tax=Paenibacillus sp. HB172176 TaxID=2493690 RepID=UPI00143AF1FB|nr:histidine phosphatase family protein [Paenibacillus sp. HB172176]